MIRKLLQENEFFRNILIISFGVGASQIIIFLFQLILRRLFTPEEFGAFDVYFNIFGILVVLQHYDMKWLLFFWIMVWGI